MARSRRLPQAGRTVSPRRGAQPSGQPPAPPPVPGPPGKSQGPAHGQGIGIGLYLLTTGSHPGQGGGGGGAPVPVFPHTSVLDNFNRADNASLGSNWGVLNPGGSGGWSGTPLGISGNAAYNPETSFANTGSAYWNPTTYTGTVEAYATASVVPGGLWGVAARCINVGGVAVKCYNCLTGSSTAAIIGRLDDKTNNTHLADPTLPANPANGDRMGIRVTTNASGNVVVQMWWYRASTGLWALIASATDSTASKITTDGNIGIIIGNPNGSSVGRFDNFGGGAS